MGRFWGVLRSTSLLIDTANGIDSTRQEADTRYFLIDTEPGTECGLRLQDAGAEDA